jgi:aryl-alcohol dehydrogenase-like predicted oxidoreductase
MEQRKFGTTDIMVSKVCLGTMTWGEQNTEAQAHAQLDYAYDHGVNFIDVAEMYPVPINPKTSGDTERFIGSWLKKTGLRSKITLATKVTGRTDMPDFRPFANETRLNREQITYALEQSLKRLNTDYIDLYQLHWPDRPLNLWGDSSGYTHIEDDFVPLLETLEVLSDFVKAGKIRHVGVSNETSWGVMKYMEYHRQHDLPKMQSIQNAYSLLNRNDEECLAEVAIREGISYLPFSPLAGGELTGKYAGGAMPEGSRRVLFPTFATRYAKPRTAEATELYQKLAAENNISLVQLAEKFCSTRPFVTSVIIGATSLDQLKENIAAFDITWTDKLEQGVEEIHIQNPSPAP